MRIELKCFRVRKNLTQQEMANKLNITKIHYGRIENGISNPTYPVLEKFADAFEETDDIIKLFKNVN